MKKFLCLALLALPLLLRAELVIYRETERATVAGNGREATVPVTTWIIYDLEEGSFSALSHFRFGANRVYAITNNVQGLVLTAGVNGKKPYSVLTRVVGPGVSPDVLMSAYFAKGRDADLPLGTGGTAILPRSFKAVTRSLRLSEGLPVSYESFSSVVFQAAETKRVNQNGEEVADVLDRLRLRLEAQGYTSAP